MDNRNAKTLFTCPGRMIMNLGRRVLEIVVSCWRKHLLGFSCSCQSGSHGKALGYSETGLILLSLTALANGYCSC